MTMRPSRKLPQYEESDPASHGHTDPPNPHKESTHRESDESCASAKNRASKSGKMGAKAAPRITIAITWTIVPEVVNNATPARTPTIAAMRSRREELMRSKSSDETPREARKPHQ